MQQTKRLIILLACLTPLFTMTVEAREKTANTGKEKGFAEHVEGLESREGLMTVHLDRKQGKVLLELPAADENGLFGRYLYSPTLRGGLGSNPVGLDRSAGSMNTYIIAFRELGNRVLVEVENWRYRATADNENERKAVRESFASSIIWSTGVLARHPDNKHVLIDFNSFLTRDAVGVSARLEQREQGQFKFAADRSMPDVDATLVFPENLEFDAYQTFTSSKPGPEVLATAPDPRSVTLIAHHSIIKLPDDGYVSRRFDERAAVIGVSFADYSASLEATISTKLARRFRLQKVDPNAARSRVKKPIVFYVDNGAPEPIRTALLEGARWWAEAFEEAGLIDAYQVEVLPEGAHPLDARYNVIQWVHRATRGWSYGGAIADPRTGEAVRGAVILGSLRVRQDRMIFEGLAGTSQTGTGRPDDPIEIALARIRQLSAHEVGHSLGFQHNMAASTYDGRASVMDYPAPDIAAREDGTLDFSNAYGVGIGSWDKFTVKYLYSQFPPGTDEDAALEAMVREAYGSGHRYVADQDARAADTGHPQGSLWDTGADPLASLQNTLAVRRIALSRFGQDNILPGQSISSLGEVIVPIYLYHRYQLEAATKVLGGMTFNYGRRGDGQVPAKIIDPETQRRALDLVLSTIDPATLDLPDEVLHLLTPGIRGFGEGRFSREMFRSHTHPAFDLLGAVDAAAGLTLRGLLHPARAGRLVEFHRRDASYPGLDEVLDVLTARVFGEDKNASSRHAEIRRTVQHRYVISLVELAEAQAAPVPVRATVEGHLRALRDDLDRGRDRDPARRMSRNYLVSVIDRYFDRPAGTGPVAGDPPQVPPGSPIGAGAADHCRHCSFH